ncbi:MAG: hypothetical protein RI885_530 [Actinomycetota bacterium]
MNARRGAPRLAAVVDRLRSRRTRLLAVIAIVAIASTGSIVGQSAPAAYAIDYPSWNDVLAARNNEAAKAQEVTRIQSLLVQLEQQVAAANALAIQRGNEYQAAQQEYDEAAFKADQLQAQADEARTSADESKLRAGQLAARLSRDGGTDVSASLFFDSGSADELLEQLGMADKITDQSAGIYEKAVQDENTAQSLSDQASVARDALKALADAAAAALDAANAAADAAAAALAESQEQSAVLNAQLAVLTQNREVTEADYQAGVVERERLAAIARAERAAAEAAARAAGGGGPAGQVASSGWARPSAGGISSSYGMRINPYNGRRAFHAGTDLGAGCGYPIYAAHSGTVTYAGPNGGYGNFVQVTGGDGVATAYGHIVNGGILVGRGQGVSAGQLIARVGSTGGSTGCHLHFEVRIGGGTVDPVPFMRDRGAAIG